MENIKLEEKFILEYIKDMLNDSKIKKQEVINARYHHNTEYNNALSVIKNGILTLEELNKRGIKTFTKKQLEIFSDSESHINDKDGVSLAVAGLNDLYKNEEEYDPFNVTKIDFLVSSDIKAHRMTYNYGNEFIHNGIILPDKLKSVDSRLINLIDSNKYKNTQSLINKYNYLKQMALSLKEDKMDIPLREMSKENFSLDIDKISNNPTLTLK